MTVIDRVRGHLRPTDDEHRVTTLELLFDLVFVYAITNVTHLMEEHVAQRQCWRGSSPSRSGSDGEPTRGSATRRRPTNGLLRVAMVIAMAGMFFVAISIPYAFSADSEAAMVLAIAYAVVRLTRLAVYLVAAGDDRQLRSIVLGMLAVASVMLVPLIAGAAVGGEAQKWWWVAAVAVDQAGVYFVRSTRWRLNSASHFAERFGLILTIAIGESIVAVGAATSGRTRLGTGHDGRVDADRVALRAWVRSAGRRAVGTAAQLRAGLDRLSDGHLADRRRCVRRRSHPTAKDAQKVPS